MTGAFLLVVALGSIPRASFETSLHEALSPQNAPFCSEPSYTPRPDHDICQLAHADGQRCPNLLKACREGGTGSGSRREDGAGDDDSAGLRPFAFQLGKLGDVLFWTVIGILAATLLFFGGRALLDASRSRRDEEGGSEKDAEAAVAPVARMLTETDVTRLLAMAEQLAAASRFEEAIAAAYAALIRSLGEAGLITVDTNRTNGDHLRDLSDKRELQSSAREVFRGVEMVQFGRRSATAALYAALRARILPIVERGAVVLLLLAGAHVLTSCDVGGQGEGSSRGFGVLTTLLTENGTKVRRRLREGHAVDPDVGRILVVGHQPAEASQQLLEWVEQGGELFVGQLDLLAQDTGRFKAAPEGCHENLRVDAKQVHDDLHLAASRPRAFEVLPPPKGEAPAEVFVRCGNSAFVARHSYGEGTVTYFADVDFLRNASLSVGDDAYVAVGLLNEPGKVLELVGPWTGAGASSSLSSLRQAGFGPIVLGLLAFGLVLAWHYGTALGRRKDPEAVRRRAFVDHVRALGASYARARSSRFALGAYGAWVIDRLRERLSPGQSVGLIDLSGVIARRARMSEPAVVTMLADAREAQEDAEGRAPSDLVKMAELEKLLFRTGGLS
jgi:hypothetical protein